MASEHDSVQVVVVGAGPGGYAAAFRAADLGLNVTLVDPEPNPGGVCLYRGCIPSKALLHAARVLRLSHEAVEIGLKFERPVIDLDRLREWKDGVVAKLTQGLGALTRQRRVRYLKGRASFLDGKTLNVDAGAGRVLRIAFEQAILATGSRSIQITEAPSDSDRVWDSTVALELREIPDSLLVIGGGYIGLEMGTVYAALGSRVTVVEMMETILPGMDKDLIAQYKKAAESAFERILEGARVVDVREKGKGLRVRFEDARKQSEEGTYDRILVAVGRKPAVGDLGLENTRIELAPSGYVKVDRERRTREETIFAIGDLAGPPLLAHKASHEGKVAAEVIAGRKSAFEPRAIPAVQFTDPEIAFCGLTETEAARQGRSVKIARFPWAASGRAATLGRSAGLTKLVVDPDTERVLGMGIVGPEAGEMISEGVLAVEMAALVSDLAATIHPHPTLSETIMEAAEAFYGESTHYFVKRKT
ncbi:MAG: dihydrolipoyl dehydrogenase [Vicinamibacteria bacterium]|nr:dihydrolipoyl dehydrogenase [Vicinamibacteria bacterium]